MEMHQVFLETTRGRRFLGSVEESAGSSIDTVDGRNPKQLPGLYKTL